MSSSSSGPSARTNLPETPHRQIPWQHNLLGHTNPSIMIRWRYSGKTQLRWFMHMTNMCPKHVLSEVFQACPNRRVFPGKPRICWWEYICQVGWEHLCVPQMSCMWWWWPCRRRSGLLCFNYCLVNLGMVKQQKMDGDGWKNRGLKWRMLTQFKPCP